MRVCALPACKGACAGEAADAKRSKPTCRRAIRADKRHPGAYIAKVVAERRGLARFHAVPEGPRSACLAVGDDHRRITRCASRAFAGPSDGRPQVCIPAAARGTSPRITARRVAVSHCAVHPVNPSPGAHLRVRDELRMWKTRCSSHDRGRCSRDELRRSPATAGVHWKQSVSRYAVNVHSAHIEAVAQLGAPEIGCDGVTNPAWRRVIAPRTLALGPRICQSHRQSPGGRPH
jgi:hypothetical protein